MHKGGAIGTTGNIGFITESELLLYHLRLVGGTQPWPKWLQGLETAAEEYIIHDQQIQPKYMWTRKQLAYICIVSLSK